MAFWKKRRFDDYDIDYDAIEEMLADTIEYLGEKEIDFTRPVNIAFNVSLDSDGFLKVNEFGIQQPAQRQKKEDDALVDVIDMDSEIMVVIETNNLPAQDLDVKVMESSMVISSRRAKKFVKRIPFPCKVRHSSVRTNYNNNILEVRLIKREYKQTIAKEKQ